MAIKPIPNLSEGFCLSKEEATEKLKQIFSPKFHDWIFVVLHCTVFVIGLGGNFLVCHFVYRNQSMRTVTNYYIVNLAVADFLVILICLPPSVTWDVTKSWYFGDGMCKIVLYFQDVSVSVSVYTLTFISVDRWWAICRPLKSKSSIRRTRYIIVLVWVFSLILLSPDLVFLEAVPYLQIDSNEYFDCNYSWNTETAQIHQVLVVFILYFLPFLFMSIAYYKIALVLWDKNIPGANEISSGNELSRRSSHSKRIRSDSKSRKI